MAGAIDESADEDYSVLKINTTVCYERLFCGLESDTPFRRRVGDSEIHGVDHSAV